MATYNLTVTTGAAEEKGLALYLAKVNADRAAEVPPKSALTTAQLLQRVIDNAVQDYKRQYKQDLRDRTGAALDNASGAQVTQVAAILGVTE